VCSLSPMQIGGSAPTPPGLRRCERFSGSPGKGRLVCHPHPWPQGFDGCERFRGALGKGRRLRHPRPRGGVLADAGGRRRTSLRRVSTRSAETPRHPTAVNHPPVGCGRALFSGALVSKRVQAAERCGAAVGDASGAGVGDEEAFLAQVASERSQPSKRCGAGMGDTRGVLVQIACETLAAAEGPGVWGRSPRLALETASTRAPAERGVEGRSPQARSASHICQIPPPAMCSCCAPARSVPLAGL
jgi:hypothetical protein